MFEPCSWSIWFNSQEQYHFIPAESLPHGIVKIRLEFLSSSWVHSLHYFFLCFSGSYHFFLSSHYIWWFLQASAKVTIVGQQKFWDGSLVFHGFWCVTAKRSQTSEGVCVKVKGFLVKKFLLIAVFLSKVFNIFVIAKFYLMLYVDDFQRSFLV